MLTFEPARGSDDPFAKRVDRDGAVCPGEAAHNVRDD